MDTNASGWLPQPVLSDRLLLEQACAGDDSAFETLVDRYQSQLYRFVCANLDSDEADDVVQFVWVQLYRCLSILQSDSAAACSERSLKPWLFRVAWNRCLEERRRRKRDQHRFYCGTIQSVTFMCQHFAVPTNRLVPTGLCSGLIFPTCRVSGTSVR